MNLDLHKDASIAWKFYVKFHALKNNSHPLLSSKVIIDKC